MFRHNVYYEGVTNEKTHVSDGSPSETGGCVRNTTKEHENEEDEEFKKYTSGIYDNNESEISIYKT